MTSQEFREFMKRGALDLTAYWDSLLGPDYNRDQVSIDDRLNRVPAPNQITLFDKCNELAKIGQMVIPVHTLEHLKNLAIDTEKRESYVVAENEQEFKRLQEKNKQALLKQGFTEEEASKFVEGFKPLYPSQKGTPPSTPLDQSHSIARFNAGVNEASLTCYREPQGLPKYSDLSLGVPPAPKKSE